MIGGCGLLLAAQLNASKHHFVNGKDDFMTQYIKGIVDGLPKRSIFLTNYDQQWSTLRYLQACENYRADVTVLSLSLMTYPWFQKHLALYPEIKMPGTHLVIHGAKNHRMHKGRFEGATGFSYYDFLNANYDNVNGNIFIGGSLGLQDTTQDQHFEFFATGLLRKAYRKGTVNFPKWRKLTDRQWKRVKKNLPRMPDPLFYNDETWESTVAIDFWRARVEHGTQLLDFTVETQKVLQEKGKVTEKLIPLYLESAYILERSLHRGRGINPLASEGSLYKNLGIAYSRIVQTKAKSIDPFHLPKKFSSFVDHNESYPLLREVFEKYIGKTKSWKEVASLRVLDSWAKWITLEGSNRDPAFETIKNVVNVLKGVRKNKKK